MAAWHIPLVFYNLYSRGENVTRLGCAAGIFLSVPFRLCEALVVIKTKEKQRSVAL